MAVFWEIIVYVSHESGNCRRIGQASSTQIIPYIGYYAKCSLFNLKGSKSKVTKMELRLKSVFQWGHFNFIWYAEQYKQKVIRNLKCMEFTMGQTSDSMTSMAYHFHRWVSAWCSVSLAGPTVAQLGFCSSWLSVSWAPFSLFPGIMFIYLIISPGWYID